MKLKYYVELFDEDVPFNQPPHYVYITDNFPMAFLKAQELAKKNTWNGVFIDTKINGEYINICGVDMYGTMF